MTKPLPLQSLHHVAVSTQWPDESIAFYRDVLGFREVSRPPFDFRGAWLFNYGFQILIIEDKLASQVTGKIDTRANHLAFAVDDIEPVRQTLNAHDIEFIENVNAGGIHQIFFRDPDGNHIEIAVHSDASLGYQG